MPSVHYNVVWSFRDSMTPRDFVCMSLAEVYQITTMPGVVIKEVRQTVQETTDLTKEFLPGGKFFVTGRANHSA